MKQIENYLALVYGFVLTYPKTFGTFFILLSFLLAVSFQGI